MFFLFGVFSLPRIPSTEILKSVSSVPSLIPLPLQTHYGISSTFSFSISKDLLLMRDSISKGSRSLPALGPHRPRFPFSSFLPSVLQSPDSDLPRSEPVETVLKSKMRLTVLFGHLSKLVSPHQTVSKLFYKE